MKNMKILKQINKEINESGLSPVIISELSGISKATINRIINNPYYNPKIDILHKIRKVLELPYNLLKNTKMSMYELSKLSGVDESILSRIKNNSKYIIRADTFDRIVNALNNHSDNQT